jgi:hypothetical protein
MTPHSLSAQSLGRKGLPASVTPLITNSSGRELIASPGTGKKYSTPSLRIRALAATIRFSSAPP